MCYVACVLLYKEGLPLEEISCPCGHGYWDVFQERFVSGDEVREKQADSKAEYEQRVQETFTESGEYEARMRAQYITHFNTCETKKAIEEAIRQEGGILDTSTAERSARELEEIERGDFTSRGLSITLAGEVEREGAREVASGIHAPFRATQPQLRKEEEEIAPSPDDLKSPSAVDESSSMPPP